MDKKYSSTAGRGFLAILFVVFISSSLIGAGPQQSDKQKIVSRVAQDWIKIGLKQYEKGFYSQAEKSFLRALDYEKYLSAGDINQINEHLTKARTAGDDSGKIEEEMKKGGQLFAEGKLAEAQKCYEQAKSYPNVSAGNQKYIEDTLKEIDQKIKQRQKVAGQTYKDSVKFFEKKDYENARKGFLEVSREDLFQTENGKSAEQYLTEIDAVLIQRTEFPSLVEEKIVQAKATEEEGLLTEMAMPIEAVQVKAVEIKSKPKLSVKESYGLAVVKNAVDSADTLTKERRFYHAKNAVDKAYNALSENRSLIGEELYNQYNSQLKVLSDIITASRTEWLGETEG